MCMCDETTILKNPLPEHEYLEGGNSEEKEERMKSKLYKEERHFGFI